MSVVYIISPSGTDRSYVGSTKNLSQRLRQHNREIKGGAKRTGRHKNWSIVCFVSGFATWRETLAFEWALQHPKKTKKYRDAIRHAVENTRKPGREGSLKRRLVEVRAMVSQRPDLQLKFMDTSQQIWNSSSV